MKQAYLAAFLTTAIFRCFEAQYFWMINENNPQGMAKIQNGKFSYTFNDTSQSTWQIEGTFQTPQTLTGTFRLHVVKNGAKCDDEGAFKATRQGE